MSEIKHKTFNIWAEGYAVTGQSSGAQKLASSVKAPTFAEACRKHFRNDKYFDAERLTYWGCKLFDNEAAARVTYG